MATRRAVLAMTAAQLLCSTRADAAAALAQPLVKLVMTMPPRAVEGLVMTRADGSADRLEAYRGKLVVLNLWASWCVPCREEMPTLSRLADAVMEVAVTVLPLAIERRGADAVRDFFAETGIANLPVRLGDGDNIAKVFAAWGLPYTVLIDAEGREFGRVTGPAQWDDAAFVAWLKRRA